MNFSEALFLYEENEEKSTDGNSKPVPKKNLIRVRKKNLYRDHRNELKVKVPTGYSKKTDPKGNLWLVKKITRDLKKGQKGPSTFFTIEWDAEKNKWVYVKDVAGATKSYRERIKSNKRTAVKRMRSAKLTRQKNKRKGSSSVKKKK